MKRELLTAAFVTGIFLSPAAQAQTTLYGITNANAIFTMSNTGTPSAIGGPYAVSGVASGQALVGLDARPSTGGLYALGYDSIAHTGELYLITSSGTAFTATAVTGALASIDLGTTNNVAMDFVSTVDGQIRIVGRNGNNYVMSALSGSVLTTGTSGLSFGLGDLHTGTGVMAATAYTNSFYGSDATTQVGYDVANNVLVKTDAGGFLNGFNNTSNVLHSIGLSTGVVFSTTSSFGMDTWFDTITHNNTIYLTGTTLLSGGAHLYKYNMSITTGALTDLGAIGSGSLSVRDIAFATVRDSTSMVTGRLMTGLSLNLRKLVYFDSYHPQNILREVKLSGVTTGQAIIGIDYSATGTLYGLGYNSISHTYQLYSIDSLTGTVTAVNTMAGTLNLGTDDGSGNYINAGFRFIATSPSRIRVTGFNGAVNVQLDAVTGTIASTDAALTYVTGDAHFGGTANLTSIAYTGFAGDSVTQMFGFDATTGAMVKFNATNSLSGYGNGSSGFINTELSLSSILSLMLPTSAYNNSYLNITYDQATATNIGVLAANYLGDSSAQLNYSILYDMSSMLVGYHKGTAGAPVQTGRIGTGTPLKDITFRRSGLVTTAVPYANTASEMFFYPNPVISSTRVMLGQTSIGEVKVDVISMNGHVDRSYTFAPGSQFVDVDMSRLPVGLYSVRVSGKGLGLHNLKVQ